MIFIKNIDDQKVSILVALDLSAAFDTLDHSTLLQRLSRVFGVRGLALNWIETYLTNRKQFVKVDNQSSDILDCPYGVPQGSVLGPLLFSLIFLTCFEHHRVTWHVLSSVRGRHTAIHRRNSRELPSECQCGERLH